MTNRNILLNVGRIAPLLNELQNEEVKVKFSENGVLVCKGFEMLAKTANAEIKKEDLSTNIKDLTLDISQIYFDYAGVRFWHHLS